MRRRMFIKDSGLLALGIGVFGNIRREQDRFIGDSPTTSDILGPYYRPGAPFRKNLNPTGFKGEVLHLSGTIFKEDGKTPLKNCLIEIWQCDEHKIYDNVSDEFNYRASQKTGADGKYQFITTTPIPYENEVGSGIYRPAHIHMRISAEGQQDLITQVYLQNDPYLDSDPSTKNGLSVNRILPLKKVKEKESEIHFDLVLKKEYLPDPAVFNKVSGVYKMSDQSTIEFFRDGDLLFFKWNHVLQGGLSFRGNNTFAGGAEDMEAKFEILSNGDANVQFKFIRRRQFNLTGKKILKY